MLWQIFALDPHRLTPIERLLLRVAFVIALFVFAWTSHDNLTHPGDDLRNRVVGARVMLAGRDPYTYAWQPGDPEQWLDPVHDPHAHRLTVSPPTLLLYAPLAPLPWRTARLVSFLAEWLALVGSLMLLARILPNDRQRVILLVGAVLFVIATDFGRLHLERGQIYVFHLLALSAALFWSRRGDIDSFAAGAALGVLALMRPNLLVMAPALLLARRWRSGGALLGAVGVGVSAALLALPTSAWQSYLAVGDQYYRAIQGEPIVSMPRPAHEGPVEGTEFAGAHSLKNIQSSSFAVLWSKMHEHWHWPMIDLALASKAALAALAIGLMALVWVSPESNPRGAFALIVVIALDTEFFLPHRWGYADVMLLAPVALLLPDLLRPVNWGALALVLLGLAAGSFGQQFFDLYAATLLRSWLVMAGLTWQVLAASEGLEKAPRHVPAP